MDEQLNTNKPDPGSLSVKDLFFKYIRFLPYFILSVALALLLAFTYLRYVTRVYSASGSMLIKSQQNNQSDKVEDILMGGNKTLNIQSEIEILKSRPLMARVVKKLGLQFSNVAMGRIRDQNVYGQAPFLLQSFKIADSSESFAMNIKFINDKQFRVNNEASIFGFNDVFTNKFGVFQLKEVTPPTGGAEYNILWSPVDSRAASLAGKITVQPKVGGTGILVISMEADNPRMAADIVNSLMVQYDSLTIEQSNYSIDQKLVFIEARLNDLKHELDSIQLILLDYRQKNNLIDVPTQSGASFEKIGEADKYIAEQQMKINIAEFIEEYLQDKKNQFSQVIVPSSLGLEDLVLNELVNGYNKAQLERKILLESDIPLGNPAIRAAEGVIEQQRQSVLENLKNIKFTYNAAVNSLRGRSNAEEAELKQLPFKMKEVVELERQVSTKLALYTLIEGKREEAAISRASTISNSSIIDRASVSTVPVKPNRFMIQMIAILSGLGLPALLIFISEILNDKINTRYDIERVTDVPILGEIGHSYSNKTLIVNKTSRSMVAEQFRTIRSNLDYVLTKTEKPIILVTSSFSGEGKSFASTNIGAVLALTGKKTIVLEFDIRKPKVLTGLNMSKGKGISNFLVGKAELEDLILPVPDYENLFILPCGPIPPNPSELLLNPKVTEIFMILRKHFDIIIIDTAPVGMVSDALTLGKFADCTLYMVRQGHTYKKQVALIDEMYRENRLPKVSIVINDIKVKPGYGYYGYGRYGYGYGYGHKNSYYEEESPSENFLEKWLRKLTPRSLLKSKKKN